MCLDRKKFYLIFFSIFIFVKIDLLTKIGIFRIVCWASNLMQSRGLQCSFLLSFKFCFLYLLFRNKITSLGQRRGFSSLDIQKLNKLYQCQNLVTCKDFYTPQSGLCQTWKTKGGCERSFHISCFPSLCLSSSFFYSCPIVHTKKSSHMFGFLFSLSKKGFYTLRQNLNFYPNK